MSENKTKSPPKEVNRQGAEPTETQPTETQRKVSLGGLSSSQLLLGVAILCGLAALMDMRHFAAHDDHHGGHEPHIRFESWFNFFGFVAVLATFAMASLAKLAGGLLRRSEGYYGE